MSRSTPSLPSKDESSPNQHLKQIALQQLREAADLSQAEAAHYFGMKDRRSIGAWELGQSQPHPTRRDRFITYLLDKLGLRRQPQEFLQLWQAVMVAQWGWPMLDEDELRRCFPGSIRNLTRAQNQVVVTFWSGEKRRVPFLAPPLPPHDLIGRQEVLEKLKQRLFSGHNQVLTALNGLPGVGKTALAIKLAHDPDIIEHFYDGILWARLGPEPNLPALLATWGAALELPSRERNSLEAWAEAMHARIGMHRMLLIIDDAWQPEAALAFKVGGPNCVHLITTRFPQVAVYFAGSGTVAVHELDIEAGLSLLTRLAPEVVSDEPDESRELVRAVGGLPLALILAGNYLRILSLSGHDRQLALAWQRLRQEEGERLRLAQPQGPLERHPSLPPGATISLEAVIDVSANALPETARSMLVALSVFPAKPNSFSRAAALAVTAAAVTDLDKLADYGLLETADSDRYTLHQTIADYAALQFEDQAVYERMVAYFIEYVRTNQQDYFALEVETTNVLAALEIAYQQQMAGQLVQLIDAFYDFLHIRNLYDLAELHLHRAEQAARNAADLAGVATICQYLGRLAIRRGLYQEAKTCYLESLRLAQRIGLDQIEADSLRHLGVASWYQGDFSLAMDYYERALPVYKKCNDQKGEGAVLSNMGIVFGEQGQHARARKHYTRALVLKRQAGDLYGEGKTLNLLGGLALTEGHYEAAGHFVEQYLSICKQLGNRQATGVALTNLGILFSDQGNYVRARGYFDEALDICRQLGDRQGEGFVIGCLAMLNHRLGDNEAAQEYSRQAIEIGRDIGDRANEAYALTVWGHALLVAGNLTEAHDVYRQALAIRRELDQQHLTLDCLAGLAGVYLAQSKATAALGHIEEILHYLNQAPERVAKASIYTYLTCYRVLRANGDDRAKGILETAYTLLQKRAEDITSAESRRLFLENVSVHREIVEEFGSLPGSQKVRV